MARRAAAWSLLGHRAECEYLFEENGCEITKLGNEVALSLHVRAWTKRHTALARRYDVNSVSIDDFAFGTHRTADFLLGLPALQSISINIWKPVDLSALAVLGELRSLRIAFGVSGWRLGDKLQPVDFSRLARLEDADVMLCSAFQSILTCRKIKRLSVTNDCDHRLRDLDLTSLSALRELELDHCPKLRSVRLHPKAKVRALKVALCGSYKIDWERFGPDLKSLTVGGRLTFRLEDVLNAPNLEKLYLLEIRKLPPLGFLRQLEKLRVVFNFSAPPGPKFSDDDLAVLREYPL